MQVDNRNVTVGSAGDEGARTIGLNEDARCAVTDRDSLGHFAGGTIDDGQVRSAESGNKHQLAIGSEFQPVGAADVGSKRLRDLLARNVDDGDGPITRVGYPDFFAVRGNIEPFRTFADRNDGLVPIAARSAYGAAWGKAHFSGRSI